MMRTLPSHTTVPAQSRGARPRGLRAWVWRPGPILIATVLVSMAAIYNSLVWPWISRWGATDEEANRVLPGDDLVPHPAIVTTKAVTINAKPEQIWPWLLQLGVDRAGMYSYLWVENWLLRLNVTNVDYINAAWQDLKEGDFIRFTPKDYALNPGPGLHVLELIPNRALVGCFGMENEEANCGVAPTWQFILEPVTPATTHLLLRSRTAGSRVRLGTKVGGALQFYMERKMLLTLKACAESSARPDSVFGSAHTEKHTISAYSEHKHQ